MAKVVIDSTSAESNGAFKVYDGPVPPAGLYRAKVGYAKYGAAKSGNMMLTVVLEFETDNEKKKQYNGYSVWHNLVQLPQTLWRTKEFLTAIGQPTKLSLDFDEDTGKVNQIGRAKPGKIYLLAKCSIENDNNGNPRLKVDSLTPLPNQPVTAEDEDEVDGEYADEAEELRDEAPIAAGGFADEPPF